MQNPKTSGSIKSSSGSRSVSSDTTPRSSSSRVVRQLKTAGFEPNSSTTQKTPKTVSPKTVDRTSPRVPVTEKRSGRVAELENQVTQLEDALRTIKDQLIVSESWKKQAKIDAQDSRNELLALTLRLQESQRIIARSCSNEADDVQVLHDDESQKLKFESIQEPYPAESAALAAALLEIDQLKVKLNTTTESESKKTESAHVEINILKENMAETLSLMEEMKNQLENSKSSESKAQVLANETLQQLETAKKTMESLKLNSDEYKSVVFELEQSRERVNSLEAIVKNVKSTDQESQTSEIMVDLKRSKADIEELKANLMDKETELQCVLEENENLNAKLTKLITGVHENESKQDFKQLETELRDENEKLKMEIEKLNGVIEVSKQDFNSLKSKSTNLETELHEKSDENKKLKLEIEKMNGVIEASKQDYNNLTFMLTGLETELCKKSEENDEFKLEIKKSNDEVAKMTNQLEEVNMRKCEIEEELKKQKVQMGQWRKAAEAATAMLCDENGDKSGRMVVDRTWSMGHFSPRKRMNLGSPCNVDIDEDNEDDDGDEFLKRRNGNMLKRIGVLWKKPQNK